MAVVGLRAPLDGIIATHVKSLLTQVVIANGEPVAELRVGKGCIHG